MFLQDCKHDFKVNSYPHIIKYMGSKTKIMDHVVDSINQLYKGGYIVDLFAGSSSLSGALRGQSNIFSNDIQHYSEILSGAYLANVGSNFKKNQVLDNIKIIADKHINNLNLFTSLYDIDYNNEFSLESFKEIEDQQRNLVQLDFNNIDFNLFTKYYSGTYWSLDQCKSIDSIRLSAENYRNTDIYYIIIASLMYAMSYTAQSTGHYAQYRVANSDTSMKDILIYRRKKIWPLFEKKFHELCLFCMNPNIYKQKLVSLDFEECLKNIPQNSTVYADPPYSFVHYSRFYHVLETLVLYDYPEIQYKGRYRNNRHQSPFSIKSKAPSAFTTMFKEVKQTNSNLILSYSNTGIIKLDQIQEIATDVFDTQYTIEKKIVDYKHSRMGRTGLKDIQVEEALLLFKSKQ